MSAQEPDRLTVVRQNLSIYLAVIASELQGTGQIELADVLYDCSREYEHHLREIRSAQGRYSGTNHRKGGLGKRY